MDRSGFLYLAFVVGDLVVQVGEVLLPSGHFIQDAIPMGDEHAQALVKMQGARGKVGAL